MNISQQIFQQISRDFSPNSPLRCHDYNNYNTCICNSSNTHNTTPLLTTPQLTTPTLTPD